MHPGPDLIGRSVNWFIVRRFTQVLLVEKTMNARRAGQLYLGLKEEADKQDFSAERQAIIDKDQERTVRLLAKEDERTARRKTAMKRKGK